ncbi:MAG: S8 family serine peptidase [Solibacillus sp.]
MKKKNMKKLMATSLATTLAVPAAIAGTPIVQAEELQQNEAVETTQLIVKLSEEVKIVEAPVQRAVEATSTDSATFNTQTAENIVQIAEQADTMELVTVHNEAITEEALQVVDKTEDLLVVEVNATNIEELKESLLNFDNVEYVEENVVYTIADMDDEYYKSQWNLKSINTEQAWTDLDQSNINYEKQVVVAVLDTGIQHNHEDLAGRTLRGKTFVENEINDDDDGSDNQGHGTFVSGFIAANADNSVGIAGVAGKQNVKILPVKVMDKNGSGTAANIAKGIEYAIAEGVDVINMSLSGEYSEAVNEAVQKAAAAGIVVVAAAGNGGGSADVSFPAALNNVISVAALAEKDQHYTRSNVGATVDLSAPGAGVFSTSMTAEKYTTGSGTSYAAPHVAGVAALYKLKHPEASAAEIEEVLKKTAQDVGTKGRDDKTGEGKVDAAAALAYDGETQVASFTIPGTNENLLGETTIQLLLTKAETIESIEFSIDGTEIGTVQNPDSAPSIVWDTTTVADGSYTLTAKLLARDGSTTEITREVTVLNEAPSGYMFNVKTPSGSVAQAANIVLYEKIEAEDGSYSYKELWTGLTNSEGVVRVPSYIGTDLKTLQVTVQGTFDAEEGNTWFMYNREVSSIGTVELSSINTVPVQLTTTNKAGEELPGAEYYISMHDKNGVKLTAPKQVNNSKTNVSPTVYIDKGAYDIHSYFKAEEGTYFLSHMNTNVVAANSLLFDANESGQVIVNNDDEGLVNATLYLYSDNVSNTFGSSEVLHGKKFFVSPGDYKYLIDAEVKDSAGGENWIYVFESDSNVVKVTKDGITEVKAGGSLQISKFESDYDSLRRYYTQRGLTYIERDETKNIAHKLDGAFYTQQAFTDKYNNGLVGLKRGSIDSEDALYVRDAQTGATTAYDNGETTITALDFGNIYAKYKVVNTTNNKTILDSHAKNPTNAANRGYYWYAFWVTTSSDITPGLHEVSLEMDPTPLAPEGLYKKMDVDMQNSSVDLKVKDTKGTYKPAYVTIMSATKDEDGDYEWDAKLTRWTDSSRTLSIPTNLPKDSDINVAVIRYSVASGEYAYLFKPFKDVSELDGDIEIPDNMQKVAINAYNGDESLTGISTKEWLIKYPVATSDDTAYASINNFYNYKKDSIYLAPGTYTFEGNYVSLQDENSKRSNYYFLNEDVEITDTDTNEVKFDTTGLAKVAIEADTEGFTDVRGAILYPFNKYSSSFTGALRVGHEFYLPTNIDLDLQVQLGYGDKESTDIIWNYFLSKGEKNFAAGDAEMWNVGGQFAANVHLTSNEFKQGDVTLNGHTTISDAYENTITSVLVNKTSDYTITGDEDIVYTLRNGEIIASTVNEDGSYTITHGGHEANEQSVKPVLTVYNEQGDVVYEKSNLHYYTQFHDLALNDLAAGNYYAQVGLAASPQGPIKSAAEQGAFSVVGEAVPTPEEDKDPVIPTTPDEDKKPVTPSKPEEDKGSTTPEKDKDRPSSGGSSSGGSSGGSGSGSSSSNSATNTTKPETTSPATPTPEKAESAPEVAVNTTKEQVISPEAIQQGTKAELQLGEVKVTVPTKQLAAAAHTVTVEEKNGQLFFSATANNVEVQFDDYVVLEFTATEFTSASDFAFVRVLEDGTYASVPHTIKDGVVTLKVRKGGTFAVTTEKKTFADAANNGHADYINKLAQRQIITGKTDTSFEPNAVSTRAHFAAIISRALDLSPKGSSTFTDTKGKWFENEVQALFDAGIVRGKDATTFDPNAAITRQQAAVMLSRVVTLLNIDTPTGSTKAFTDMNKMSAEGQQAAVLLQKLGVFTGKEDGSFDPGAQLTRAQMAKAVYKLLEAAELL